MKLLKVLLVTTLIILITGCQSTTTPVESIDQSKVESVVESASEAVSEKFADLDLQLPDKVSLDEATKLIAENDTFKLVDVRTEMEYNQGYVPGAILLPVDDLEAKASEELPDKNQVIVVYCRSGNRSNVAANILREMGYKMVIDAGGIINYTGELTK